LLFTGDAGIQALTQAIDYAEARGVSLTGLDYIQVPHHGSRRNVSPSVLDRMMGKTAFVSASPGSTTHPRKKVTNAFIRRGATVYQTRGGALCQPYNRPRRAGYGDAPPIPFSDKVEE
jgi:beta-lactamase superfamily II metal-dependent hydrolase